MLLLKRTFGLIWAIWAGFWFMIVVIILTPIYAIVLGIFGKRYSMQCVWINAHYASPFLLFVSGLRLKVFGKEKIDTRRAHVYVANHTTQIDIISCAAAMRQPMRFLAKAETKKIPVFGYMVKMLGIMVDRSNKESREKSVKYMVEELKRGNSILLYPEGTRNRTPEPLKDFKEGAFRVAVMAQAPILVQTLVGAKKLNNPVGLLQLFPGKLELYYSDVIETTGLTLDDVPMLVEKVRAEMLSHLAPTFHHQPVQ